MKTWPRSIPISPSSVSSNWPAWPTNGLPWRSSFLPGASPTNISSASALPIPKTRFVRLAASGQPRFACSSRYSSTSSARRSSGGRPTAGQDRPPGGRRRGVTGITFRSLRVHILSGAGRYRVRGADPLDHPADTIQPTGISHAGTGAERRDRNHLSAATRPVVRWRGRPRAHGPGAARGAARGGVRGGPARRARRAALRRRDRPVRARRRDPGRGRRRGGPCAVRGACERRHAAERLGSHGRPGLRSAPAADGHLGRRRAARLRLCRGGLDPRRARARLHPRPPARHDPLRGPRRPARRLPRGCVDRVELPRHPRVDGRDRRRARRDRCAARAARPHHRRELDRVRAARRAHRAGRAWRRGHRRGPARRRGRSRAGAGGCLRRAHRAHPCAGRGGGGVKTVRTVRELREALAPSRRAGRSIGLVPTMGFFHEGHLTLMRAARSDCDVVVVSLFVNPTQFGPNEDFSTYPRDERRDSRLAERQGVDILFAPPVEEVYPDGYATTVSIDGGLTDVLDGAAPRRGKGHFDGVTTVVTKLFNMVQPDRAYFGQKDAQQAVVIQQLVRDLDIPVNVEVVPTVREDDGLAMSSRNVYLSPEERERALALSRALAAAQRQVAAGRRDAGAVLKAARSELDARGVEPEYLELRSADDLSPARRVNGRTLLAVAARVGQARLIDNTVLGGE